MAEDNASVLTEIQDKYVPFLKKLISFLEKTKKTTPDMLNKIKSIYTVFTTADEAKQIESFQANKKKLEKWYQNAQNQKDKGEDDSSDRQSKRHFVEDTDSSQGVPEVPQPKRQRKSKSSDISEKSAIKITPIPADQIKKEKQDGVSKSSKIVESITKPVLSNSAAVNIGNTENTSSPSVNESNEITFTCASCQFQTLDDQEFMKHTRTDHRSDLSMWCKNCGKCFSNAGVLVTHIKERACVKEEMIYRCGVKDCTFQTASGQTFVHHLRHCHKGSPFIFCVHCQKIFTLPHCLILHMQDDCPFKEKNRRNPGSAPLPSAPVVATPPPKPVQTFTPITPTIASVRPVNPASASLLVNSTATSRGKVMPSARGGRGRGKGRGRGRPASSSSDSDDPDDPSWCPEETPGQVGLRRSGRWAKKINDVINIEPKAPKKSLSLSELNSKEMLDCPCCDFMAAFTSVLEDHYIAHHKVANKNACVLCHLKFENTRGFIDHFVDHASGKLPNQIVEETDKVQVKSAVVTISESSNTNNQDDVTKPKSPKNDVYDNVVKNMSEVTVLDPSKNADVKIPYQAAIHDKNLKDSKLKKFEELKSPNDLVTMKNEEKLKHFFKCILYNCSYTTHDRNEYFVHVDLQHKGKRLHCCYCLKEFFSAENLTDHLVGEHSKRNYQCSSCFYRAYSRIHIQIHIKNYHTKDTNTEIYTCEPVLNSAITEPAPVVETLNTTWPYICAVGQCKFQTFDPQDFKVHNETDHRTVTVFYCHYCKVDFISFKRLINHYRLHGINTFQCNYCIHGSETKDEILLHLCTVHADQPLQAYMRGTEEEASSEAKLVPYAVRKETGKKVDDCNSSHSESTALAPGKKAESSKIVSNFEVGLYENIDDTYYPKYVRSICSDLICGISHCYEKLENISAYIGHLRNVHVAMNFPCPHCPEVANTWDEFKNHLFCHGPDLYGCDFSPCNFYDWEKNKVTEHLKKHSPASKAVVIREGDSGSQETNNIKSLPNICPFNIEDEVFQCFFCLYKSSDKTVIKNHMYQELKYKRVNCTYCNENFISKRDLKDHTLKTHPDSDIKCSVTSNMEIEDLVKSLTKQKTVSSEYGSFSCNNCSKSFKYLGHWHKHLSLCPYELYRPYDCGYCEYSCSDIQILKLHCGEKHHPKNFSYNVVSSPTIDEEINRKVQTIKLKGLQEIFGKVSVNENTSNKQCYVKQYVCSICSYESNHKFNLETHFKLTHIGAKVDFLKSVRNISTQKSSNSELDENSNDGAKVMPDSSSDVKRYRCGFCIKKMFTLLELQKHVESLHPLNESHYFYYFSPDPKMVFSNDEEFECSYCKSGKDTLKALKTHSELMHPESQFKVKGFVIRNRESSSTVACGYCYTRLDNSIMLKKHLASQHSGFPLKSFNDLSIPPRKKRSREETDDLPNKRVRFGPQVYICSHCGAALSSKEQITAHSKKSHSRLQLEFTTITPSSTGEYDMKFYKCEFCLFTSQKEFLNPHLSTKHKMRVTCYYCNKRFEFASKLKEHHDVAHKGLALNYNQETVFSKNENDSSVNDKNVSKQFYHDSSKKDTIDLSNITLFYRSPDKKFVQISALNYSKLHNIFPKIILKDFKLE